MPYKDPEKRREAARRGGIKWRERHPERIKEVRDRHYAKHREKRCANARAWHHANKGRVRDRLRRYHLMKRYGLTEAEYAALGTACAICGATEDQRTQAATSKKFRLAVDHCHDTNKVRGLLCGKCNCGIGYFNNDAKLMAKAIGYLQRTEIHGS